MGRAIRRVVIILVVVIAALGFFEYRSFKNKKEIRREGMVYFKEQDYEKALQYFEDALDSHCIIAGELDNDLRCYMAQSYIGLDKDKQALKITRKLLDSGNEPEYFLLCGDCYEKLGKEKKAIDIYKEGYEETSDVRFHERICNIYLEKGDYDSALYYANEGLKKDESSKGTLMYQLIIIYERIGDYKKAYDVAKEYCDMYPDDEKGKKEMMFLSTRF